jgi:hypothetical protein
MIPSLARYRRAVACRLCAGGLHSTPGSYRKVPERPWLRSRAKMIHSRARVCRSSPRSVRSRAKMIRSPARVLRFTPRAVHSTARASGVQAGVHLSIPRNVRSTAPTTRSRARVRRSTPSAVHLHGESEWARTRYRASNDEPGVGPRHNPNQ